MGSQKVTLTPEQQQAFELAVKAKANAYAPYSKFVVGSAVKVKNGKLYMGANVENSAFPAGVCSERNALFSAISELGKVEFEYIVIVANTEGPTFPCGICCQVISELCGPDIPIFLGNDQGILKKITLKDIFHASKVDV
jgi:cytidine deaminase